MDPHAGSGPIPSRYFGPHHWENGEYKVHGKEVFGPDYHCDFLIDYMKRAQEQDRPFVRIRDADRVTDQADLAEFGFGDRRLPVASETLLRLEETVARRVVHHRDEVTARLAAPGLQRRQHELLYEVGRPSVTGNSDRFALLFVKP